MGKETNPGAEERNNKELQLALEEFYSLVGSRMSFYSNVYISYLIGDRQLFSDETFPQLATCIKVGRDDSYPGFLISEYVKARRWYSFVSISEITRDTGNIYKPLSISHRRIRVDEDGIIQPECNNSIDIEKAEVVNRATAAFKTWQPVRL